MTTTMTDFVPTKTEFITKAWIFNVINKHRTENQQSPLRSPEDIKSLDIKTLNSTVGKFSLSLVATVDFDCFTTMGNESFQSSLYIKMSSSDEAGLRVSMETKLLEREVRTYLELFPAIRRELDLPTDDLMLPSVPDILHGAHQHSGEGILVAENLLRKNYKSAELAAEGEVSLTSLVRTVEMLAKYHAASALLISKLGGSSNFIKDFPHISNVYNNDAIFVDTNRTLQLVKHIPGFYTHHLEFEEWRSAAWDVLSSSDNSGALTVVLHGNLSLDNVMDDGQHLLFTSWSRACLGSPLLDLELLLFSSCSRAMREENTAKLLETYFFSFCSAVKQLGSDQLSLAPALSLKFLKEEFERYKFTAFLQSVLVLMTNIKAAEEKFQADPTSETLGRRVRVLANRAVDLLDEAIINNWRRKCQVETSSLTIKLPVGRML